MKIIEVLTKNMLRCIELEIQHPEYNQKELAAALGVHVNSVLNWFHSPIYIEEREKQLKDVWRNAAKKAQIKMEKLVNNSDDKIAIQAAKYVLDSAGYGPTQKVDVNADVSNYNYSVSYEDDCDSCKLG